jgi:hypothetical protein
MANLKSLFVTMNDPDLPRKWMQSDSSLFAGEKRISQNEHASLRALIVYVASHLGRSEYSVERRVADRFDIANVACLTANRFDEAIRYLTDHMS